MAGSQVAFRTGQDAPARIAASTSMLTEASAYLPAEPYVPPIISFYPPPDVPVLPPGYEYTESGILLWTNFPSRLDLQFYQGDDVVIPIYLKSDVDMSDPATWEWYGQIREYHSFEAPLVSEFSIVAEFIPAAAPDPAMTKLNLFLSRLQNTVSGCFAWELYSVNAEDYTDFPQPEGVADEDWPPPDTLTTWLYGLCRIVRRGSTTDMLPLDNGDTTTPPLWWNGGWFVGPNGRVP